MVHEHLVTIGRYPPPSSFSISQEFYIPIFRRAVNLNGLGNVFELYYDKPCGFDAWDIDIAHRKTGRRIDGVVNIKLLKESPLRCVLSITRKFGDSDIYQKIILSADSARVDFVTKVNWRETNKLLKAAFDIHVHSEAASFEIQFGHVQRPTHFNTSWDVARFETCCQKWVDVSEADYGVALLNNGKYGHDIHDGVMRISLLRSPQSPDPLADHGEHEFTYSILPHTGSLCESNVAEEAYNLNSPIMLLDASLPETTGESYFEIDGTGIILETVKVAQDGEGIVLRLYEFAGRKCQARLCSKLPLKRYKLVDMLEKDISTICDINDGISLEFRPFQIITLYLCE